MRKHSERTVLVEKIVPGMVLDRDLLTESGRVFLRAGIRLNEKHIDGIKRWGFKAVEIRDIVSVKAERIPFVRTSYSVEERIRKLEAEDDITSETKTEQKEKTDGGLTSRTEAADDDPEVMDLPQDFADRYQRAVLSVKNEFAKARFLRDYFSVERLDQLVDQEMLPLLSVPDVYWKLQFVKRTEDYLYHHSVDVAILAGVIGQWFSCSPEKIRNLILGGILHDLGKTLVPLNVVNKPDKLNTNEWDLMRRHPVRGYKFLRQRAILPREVLYCLIQHHERLDGSGYPLSLGASDIDFVSRTIAIADSFCAMISPRCYGRRFHVFEAAEALRADAPAKLDRDICMRLLEHLMPHFRGSHIRLTDGALAHVVYMHEAIDAYPVVQLKTGEVIDLKERRDVSILRVLK